MPINSRQKGAAAEREVAELLRQHGYTARRGQQFSGSPDSPDVVHNVGPYHLEVKRTEAFNLYAAMEQALADKASHEIPVVVHRKNGKDWVAILPFDKFLELAKANESIRRDNLGSAPVALAAPTRSLTVPDTHPVEPKPFIGDLNTSELKKSTGPITPEAFMSFIESLGYRRVTENPQSDLKSE